MAPARDAIDTGALEARYVELNQRLLERLNRLQYLDQLRQAQASSDADIARQMEAVNGQWGDTITPMEMRQLVDVKTQVLGRYLNQVGPLISSAAAPPATPLAHIRQLSADVYGPQGATRAINDKFDRYVAATKCMDELVAATADKVEQKAPQLREAERRQRQTDAASASAAAARANDISATYGDRATTMADELRQVIAEWRRLRVACDLVPMVVSMSSVDWTRHPELMAVVEECQRHGDRLRAHESVVSVDTAPRYSAPALLALDYRSDA